MGRIGKDELSPELLTLLEVLAQPPESIDNYYTKEQIDQMITEVNNYLDIVLTTDKVYTKEIIDFKLGILTDKLNSISVVTNVYSKSQIDTKVSVLRDLINNKLENGSVYTKTEVQNLISTAISNSLPDLSQFYNKTTIDTKLSTYLTTTDIVDTLEDTSTTKPISSNQLSILNDKIESLKQSASNKNSLVATAITGIGVDLGGNTSWDYYNECIANYKPPSSDNKYYEQIPYSTTKIIDYPSILTAPIYATDEYTGNIYIIHRYGILVYDSNYNLITNKSLSMPQFKGLYGIDNIIITEDYIFICNYIIEKSTLNIVNQTFISPLCKGLNENEVIVLLYNNTVTDSYGNTIIYYYLYSYMYTTSGLVINKILTQYFISYNTRNCGLTRIQIDGRDCIIINYSTSLNIYDLVLSNGYTTLVLNKVLIKYIVGMDATNMFNRQQIILKHNCNILYGQTYLIKLSSLETIDYDPLVYKLTNYGLSTFDGNSNILYSINSKKITALNIDKVLWSYDIVCDGTIFYMDYDKTNDDIIIFTTNGVYRIDLQIPEE